MTLKEHMQRAKALWCDQPTEDARICIAVIADDIIGYKLAVRHWENSGQRFDDAIDGAAAKQSDDAAFDDIDPDKTVPL